MPDLQDQVNRGVRARFLLENELLTEAFKTLEDAYIKLWRETQVDNQIGRERLFLAVNVIGKVRDHLTMAIQYGSVAEAELKHLTETAERKKKFGIL